MIMLHNDNVSQWLTMLHNGHGDNVSQWITSWHCESLLNHCWIIVNHCESFQLSHCETLSLLSLSLWNIVVIVKHCHHCHNCQNLRWSFDRFQQSSGGNRLQKLLQNFLLVKWKERNSKSIWEGWERLSRKYDFKVPTKFWQSSASSCQKVPTRFW